ncbi:hypothetical protein QAD02_013386 [Eretmocerus hayati]|uniref:Uncharacterized protein n=1 Tax=Eretmocerus hayati TaxID=131215 RepID=A0ACC2P4Z3_9HYME|nr:hypothetical protein QAD02_013386 [Eretmocerus hayati]
MAYVCEFALAVSFQRRLALVLAEGLMNSSSAGARLVADRHHLLAAVVDRQRRLEAAVRAAGDGVRESVACPRCGQVGHRFYRLTSLSLLSWIPERDGDVCDFDFSIYA